MSIIYTPSNESEPATAVYRRIFRIQLILCECYSANLNVEGMNRDGDEEIECIGLKKNLDYVVATFEVGEAFGRIIRETIGANWPTTIAKNFYWPTVLLAKTKKKKHSSPIQAAKMNSFRKGMI